MRTIKIIGYYIFPPLCPIKAVHNKKNAINHECVMATKCLQLGLQDVTRIMNNYAYSGRLFK